MSGPGRFRYGGIRDFLLGVQIHQRRWGKLINAGGKVVKNAAGFDIPKFLVGSMGRLGAITELTFKVFPRPSRRRHFGLSAFRSPRRLIGWRSGRVAVGDSTRSTIGQISNRSSCELLGPSVSTTRSRTRSVQGGARTSSVLEFADDFWRAVRELNWLQPSRCRQGSLHTRPACSPVGLACMRRRQSHWSVAGNVMWILLTAGSTLGAIDQHLNSTALSGLVVRGACDRTRLGQRVSSAMETAVKQAMDPPGKFAQII